MCRANRFATTSCRSYGAWRPVDTAGYKYDAPTELTTGERILRKACSAASMRKESHAKAPRPRSQSVNGDFEGKRWLTIR